MTSPLSPASPSRVWPKHLFRLASLVVPSWGAWYVTFTAAHPGDLLDGVAFTLGGLWVLSTVALIFRSIALMAFRRGTAARTTPVLAQMDVLTSAGSALAWVSAFAIMGAVWLGWASLAVVGLLGTGLLNAVVLLAFAALRGADPLRGATVGRRFVPSVVAEGDDVTEELRFDGVRIPLGFRLFVSGRVGPRFATSRHVLEAGESGAEVVLESEVGPAVRGEHHAELLEMWLQDTFGLCRSVRVRGSAAQLTVLPKMRDAERTVPLLDRGPGPRAPRPASRMPTEGQFHLREYQQGDDVRRIHWMRSAAARALVVRLPDEIPPDRPRVRLVLDTFFPEADTLACDAPHELLDSMVSVWLAVGKALIESGARVTLAVAVPRDEGVAVVRHELMLRAPEAALRIGAQVQWQSRIGADELFTDEATYVVSRAVLARPLEQSAVRWIVVFPTALSPEPTWPSPSGTRLRYPMGSSENRWTLRRREETRAAIARRDRASVLGMRGDVIRPLPGSFFVLPSADGTIKIEASR
ncbi:MAG: hypothetical protein JWO86_7669 [Myxococcaceae bacterium]|nr:hypothetical protein [Myxococcaceae bacterium]